MRTKVHEPLAFDVVGTGLGFPEGPVFDGDGTVLVVDIDGGRVLRVDAAAAIADGIAVVTPDGEEVDLHPIPGDVTTNIAFGGPDRRRAVITLSRSGQLAETTWPRPGLRLHGP